MDFAAPPTDFETFLQSSLDEFPINRSVSKETLRCIFPIHGALLDQPKLPNFSLSISKTTSKQSYHNPAEFKSNKCNTDTADDQDKPTVQEMNGEYERICCSLNKTSFDEFLQDTIQSDEKIRELNQLEHDESKSTPQNDKDSHTILCESTCNSSVLSPPMLENLNSSDKILENNSKVEVVKPQMNAADSWTDLEETPTSSSSSQVFENEVLDDSNNSEDDNSEVEIMLPQQQPAVDDQLKDLSKEQVNTLYCDIYYDDLHYQFNPSKTPCCDVVDPRNMETIFQQREYEHPIQQVPSDSDESSDELCYDFTNHSTKFESKSVDNEVFLTCQMATSNSNLTNNDNDLFVSDFTTQQSQLQYSVVTKPSPTCNFDEQNEKDCNLTNKDEDLFLSDFPIQQSRSQYSVRKTSHTCNLDEKDSLLPSRGKTDEDVPCKAVQSLQQLPQVLAESINAQITTLSSLTLTSGQSKLFMKWLRSPIKKQTKPPLPWQPSNSVLSISSIPEDIKPPWDEPNDSKDNVDAVSSSISMMSMTDSNVEIELLSDGGTVSDYYTPTEALSTVGASNKPVRGKPANDEACVQPLKEKSHKKLPLSGLAIPLQGQPTLRKIKKAKEKTWMEKLHEERYRFGSYPFTPLLWKIEPSKMMNVSARVASVYFKTPKQITRFRKHRRLNQLRKIYLVMMEEETQLPCSDGKKELPPTRYGFRQDNPNVREPVIRKSVITLNQPKQIKPPDKIVTPPKVDVTLPLKPVFRKSVVTMNQPSQIKPPNKIVVPPKVDVTLPVKLRQEKKVPARKPKLNERNLKFNERRPSLKNKNVNSNVGKKKVKASRPFNLSTIKKENEEKKKTKASRPFNLSTRPIKKPRSDDKKGKPNVGLKGKLRNLKPKPQPLNKRGKARVNVKDKKKLLEEAKLAKILKLKELNQRKEMLMGSIKQQEMRKIAARLSFDEIQHQNLTLDEKLFMIKNVYLCKREDIALVHHRYLDMKFRIDELIEKMSSMEVKNYKTRFNIQLRSVQAKKEKLKKMGSERRCELMRCDQKLETKKDRMLLRSEALRANLEYKEQSALKSFEDFREQSKILQDTREMIEVMKSTANADK